MFFDLERELSVVVSKVLSNLLDIGVSIPYEVGPRHD